MFWPDFKFPPINLYSLFPWKQNMNVIISDEKLELLKQIQTETVKWDKNTISLAMQLEDEGFLIFPPYYNWNSKPTLTFKARQFVGLEK